MSEVKNIPRLRFPEFYEGWKTVRFKDILLNSRLGGNYSNSEEISAFPLIKMGNLDRGRIKLDKLEYVKEIENLNPEDLIQEGDLFFNTRNTLELVGKVAIWRNELPVAYYNSNLMKIDFEENRFMNYRLNSFSGIKKLRRIATGTTSVAAIYTKDLLKISISIPILSEQQKIADFLTAVDKRIELLEKKKTLLETYKKGVMKKIFNQEIRFKDDNGNDFPDWEEKKLGEISPKMKSGGTPKSTIKDYYDGDIPFLSIGDMTSQNKYLNWTSKTISKRGLENSSSWVVPNNSIIYSMYASVGFVSINKIDLSISQAVMAIQPIDEMNIEFLYYSLLNFQPKINSLIETGTQGNINGGIVKNIPIKTPSLDEQIKISKFLSSLDTQIELLDTQIDKSKTWKKGLLQKMFV